MQIYVLGLSTRCESPMGIVFDPERFWAYTVARADISIKTK